MGKRWLRIPFASAAALSLFVWPACTRVGQAAAQGATSQLLKDLRSEHQGVLDELNVKDARGKAIELDDERVPGLLRKGWKLAGAWAAAYLEEHPRASARELEGIFEGFAPKARGVKSRYGNFLVYSEYSLDGSAVRIAPSVYVVAASYGVDFRTGTFMVIARNREGHFAELWNIKDPAAKHSLQSDEIGRWTHLVRRAYYNGPLSIAMVVPLSPALNGRPRFLVDAYEAADGGTANAQLSIWEWDGEAANPLLVEPYQYTRDFKRFQFDGRIVRVSTKEELGTLFSCGTCPEPRGVWTLRITPDRIENLGHRLLRPELEWADELLSHVETREDATQLANRKVIDALKVRMLETQAQTPKATNQSDEDAFSWGMLEGCRVLRRGQRGAFVLVVDAASLQFTYELRHGRPYFTDLTIK